MSELRINSEASFVKRAIEFWPYVFIVISVTGLAYIALSATH